jgi:hypothetical protein
VLSFYYSFFGNRTFNNSPTNSSALLALWPDHSDSTHWLWTELVRVKVTLWLVLYSQWVRLGAKTPRFMAINLFFNRILAVIVLNVAYLLRARTVEAEKQPLLGNGLYTCSRGMCHIPCDIMQQQERCYKWRSLWVHTAPVAMQLCGKHISAAVNQHTTIEEVVFSVGMSWGYIMSISGSQI